MLLEVTHGYLNSTEVSNVKKVALSNLEALLTNICCLAALRPLLSLLQSCSSSLFFLFHSNFSFIQKKNNNFTCFWPNFAKVWWSLLLAASLCLSLYLCLSVCLELAIPDMGSTPAKYGRGAVNKEDRARCHTVHHIHTLEHTQTHLFPCGETLRLVVILKGSLYS